MWIFGRKHSPVSETVEDTKRSDTPSKEQTGGPETLGSDTVTAAQIDISHDEKNPVEAVEAVEGAEVATPHVGSDENEAVTEPSPVIWKTEFSKKKWKQVCRANNVSSVEELEALNDQREQEILDIVYGAGTRIVSKRTASANEDRPAS